MSDSLWRGLRVSLFTLLIPVCALMLMSFSAAWALAPAIPATFSDAIAEINVTGHSVMREQVNMPAPRQALTGKNNASSYVALLTALDGELALA